METRHRAVCRESQVIPPDRHSTHKLREAAKDRKGSGLLHSFCLHTYRPDRLGLRHSSVSHISSRLKMEKIMLKTLTAVLFALAASSAVQATVISPVLHGASPSAARSTIQTPEVANKKGSKRIGGSNSKGKGSKYRGGSKGKK